MEGPTREGTPERLFLGRGRPPLAEAAARLVAAALLARGAAGPVDLRGVTAILPGARAGRLLAEALARAAAPLGVLLPAILTPRGLLDRLAPAGESAPSELERRLAWSRAIAEARPGDLADLLGAGTRGPERAATPSPTAAARLAERLDRLATELAEEGIPIAELARASRGATERESARLEAIGRLAARAADRLARSGRSVPFAARSGAPARPDLAAPPPPDGLSPLIAIGLADPRARVRAALASLGGALAVWIHAPESEAPLFGPVGELLGGNGRDEAEPIEALLPPIDDAHWRIADTPRGQAALAVAAVAEEERAGRRPVLCVLDPEVRPLVADQLERCGFRVHDAAGRPFARTSLGALLPALREALEQADVASLAALVRHPGVDAALAARVEPELAAAEGRGERRGERTLLAALDRLREKHLPVALDDLALAAEGRAIGGAARELLAPLAGPPRPLAAWAAPIEALVDRIEGARIGAAGGEEKAREALDAALDDLAAIPESLSGEITGAAALRLLEGALAGKSLPELPAKGALELLGWLELPLDSADSAIVLGANEGLLPARDGAPDPILTPRLRAELGLPGNHHRARRDAWTLRTLVASGRPVTWISGRRGAEGDPKHPSRFLLLAGAGRPEIPRGTHPLAHRVRRFYEGRGDPVEPPPLAGSEDAAASPLALPRPTPPAEPVTKVSITALGLYLRCPYTFWLERVLGLVELHDRADELGPGLFGERIHEVLEALGRDRAIRETDDPALVETFLLDSLATVMRRYHGDRPAAAVRIQREQAAERLRALARWQAQEVREGWRIHATEASLPSNCPNFAAGGIEFTLSGTIDRIDRHEGTGRYRIVDYKTGESGESPERTHREGPRNARRWRSLQLPLYRHLAPLLGLLGGGIEGEIEVGFVLLPRDLASVGYERAPWSEEEHASALERAREALLAIHAGVFWPPRRLQRPWDTLFAGETTGARERLAASGEEEDGGGAGES